MGDALAVDAESARSRLAAAAVAGSAHRAEGIPCQDYAAVTRRGNTSAIALADGAGSARSSDVGARIAVREILRVLGARFAELVALERGDARRQLLAVVQRALSGYGEHHGVLVADLACTLLFAASDGSHFLCGQLGDGRIARFDRALTRAEPVFEPVKGEFFNETVFVASPGALAHFALEVGSLEGVGGFALMSDGSEESLFNRAEGRFAPALVRMVSWLGTHSERRVQSALERNLSGALQARTSDDLSLALLYLAGARSPAPSASEAEVR
jgi:hypothetical protein